MLAESAAASARAKAYWGELLRSYLLGRVTLKVW
jgi:hypothetical protein